MNHQFKPGDMAMIKPNSKAPHLAGKSVELVLYVGPGDSVTYVETLWHNISATEPSWIVTGEDLDCDSTHEGIRRRHDGLSFFRQSLLMPLRGDFDANKKLAKELKS